MTVKNINIFKSSPIVIKLNDSEQVRIDKVPALVTMTLYEDENFINDMLDIEKSLNEVNLNVEGDSVEKVVEAKQSKILTASSKIARYCKKYYRIIVDAITLLIAKDEKWVTDNLGYMDMWNILLLIFYKNSEESADLLKKNNTQETSL
jgi:hypothetical protein